MTKKDDDGLQNTTLIIFFQMCQLRHSPPKDKKVLCSRLVPFFALKSQGLFKDFSGHNLNFSPTQSNKKYYKNLTLDV